MKLVCALDLSSPHVAEVAALATEWARALGARLELVYVVATTRSVKLEPGSGAERVIATELRRRSQGRAAAAMEQLARFGDRAEARGVSCAVILLEGRVSEGILRRAQRADLVILGPHARSWALGDGGAIQRWIGSVASHVVRDAPCPVLLACGVELGPLPGPDAPWVAAIDFQPASLDALRAAKALRGASRAPLVLAHGVPPLLDGAPSPDTDTVLFAWYEETACRVARARLAELAVAEGLRDAVLRVAGGPPLDVIQRVVRAEGAGVLVVGDHSRAERPEPRLGSVAKRAMRESPVPVLLVRRRPAAGEVHDLAAGLA